jgi:hypothetical protein
MNLAPLPLQVVSVDKQTPHDSMQSRCDSAAGLSMLGALKQKEISYEYSQDAQQHHTQQCHQQQDAHHSHQRFCLQPAEIYEHIVEGGEGKQRNSWMKEIILGIMAGAFICFGFATCMIAAGQVRLQSPFCVQWCSVDSFWCAMSSPEPP